MTSAAPARRNIRLLEIYNISLGFMAILPVVVPFYKNQIGLSFQDFLMAEAMFAAVVVAMEVPSGWISDVWKRKHVLALGAAIDGVGITLMGFADGFWMAASAQMIIGVGVSLTSGTTSALLYDTLLDNGNEGAYRKYEGRRHAYGFYTVGFSAILGGFLYEIDPYLPVWLTVASYFLCVPVALMIYEPARHKEAVQTNPIKDMVKVMHYALRGHREIAALIFFVAILFGCTQAGMWAQQPYYMFLGIPEGWFGIFTSLGFLVGGAGSQLGHLLERWFRPVEILAGLWLCAILSWFACGIYGGYHALALLLISNAAYGMGFPLMQDAINRRVSSARRATVLSVCSLMIRLVFIPVGFVVGWIVDEYGILNGLLALASFVCVANLWNVRQLLASQPSCQNALQQPY